jgi:hypothetical protein
VRSVFLLSIKTTNIGLDNSKRIMKITLSTDECRFNGIGDWPSYDDIRVIPLGNWEYESLILIHELVESLICRKRGITAEIVDEFDKDFLGEGEPGDDPNCPYRKAHQFATLIEMALCHELGHSWPDYLSITNHIGEVYYGNEEK